MGLGSEFQGNPQAYASMRMSQPNGGSVPSMVEMGPYDLLPGQHNPFYDVYSLSRGRYLGSLGQDASQPTQAPPSADAGVKPEDYMSSVQRAMKDYPNELDALTAEDDVQGNGIFDAPGTHGNIHPDEGIFADRESLPGYLARERFFEPSEVIDINTGEPVMYVPGNGFMLDPRTQWAVDQINLYEPGMPNTGGAGVEQVSTVEPRQPGWPVEGLGRYGRGARGAGVVAPAPKSTASPLILAAVAGISIGLVYGLLKGA